MITDSLLLAELWEIKRGDFDPRHGLCWNVAVKLSLNLPHGEGWELDQQLRTMFVEWPEFSGNEEFPVAAPDMTPRWAYWDSPLYSGEYGSARIRLLNFMIRTLEQRIKDAV